MCVFLNWIAFCIFLCLLPFSTNLSNSVNSVVTCLPHGCFSAQSLSAFGPCHPLYVSLFILFDSCLSHIFASFYLCFPHTRLLCPSVFLSSGALFYLVVIKPEFSSITEPVFESSSGCQRACISPPLDVPPMTSLCLQCLPTMPLLFHQPITAL